MLLEADSLREDMDGSGKGGLLHGEAVGHFLESLLAWGPTSTLKEYIQLYRLCREKGTTDESVRHQLRAAEIALQRRYLQTCAGYLKFPISEQNAVEISTTAPTFEANKDDSKDSLFLVSSMLRVVAPRAPDVALLEELDGTEIVDDSGMKAVAINSLLALESMARLRMMQNHHDLALKCFLTIGLYHSTQSLKDIELCAIDIVNANSRADSPSGTAIAGTSGNYHHVLEMVEHHHLHRLLLDEKLTNDESAPLLALIQLVGFGTAGRFLMDHCVSPELPSLEANPPVLKQSESKDPSQKETLPIDLVARQFQRTPALLHWYLYMVLTKKPELYVNFPSNFIPSKAVTELHRKHLELFVEFAGDRKDSAKVFTGIEPYKAEIQTTPLLLFLKAALPIGGLSPVEARRLLEIERNRNADGEDSDEERIAANGSNIFSLELAYIIEHYSEETEAEAIGVLDLYLKEVNSLMLAVSYAQRQRRHSSLLWDRVIRYCLDNKPAQNGENGTLFGALLEASALCGADVARLVSRIPPGMIVEGLRPRLVAAVADYRLKLDIHEAAASAAQEEKLSLLRELAHRSKRGARFQLSFAEKEPNPASGLGSNDSRDDGKSGEYRQPRPPNTKVRRDRYRLSYSIPIR
eukprot:scaffold1888_cov120-Cylindrotheca_fusiformis.AAC.11